MNMKILALLGISLAMSGSSMASLTNIVINDEKESLLADSIGKTLYVFDLDQGKSIPTCTGDCAEVWPPYIIADNEVPALMPPLGFIKRGNGKPQLTYLGRPLYTYIFDRLQGDDKGDGLGTVWHYIKLK